MLNSRLVDQAQKLDSQAQQLHYLDSPTPEAKKYSRAFWNWKSDKKEAMVQLKIKNYQKDFFHEGQLPSVRVELSNYIIMQKENLIVGFSF